MDWQQLMREVGALTQDEELVKGVLATGAAAMAVVLTAWRVLRHKPETPRVRIDAPANVEVTVRPVDSIRRDSTRTIASAIYRPANRDPATKSDNNDGCTM